MIKGSENDIAQVADNESFSDFVSEYFCPKTFETINDLPVDKILWKQCSRRAYDFMKAFHLSFTIRVEHPKDHRLIVQTGCGSPVSSV